MRFRQLIEAKRLQLVMLPLASGFGLETSAVDVSRPLPDAEFAALERALFRGQVLVLSGQCPTPQQYVAFARRFGPPEPAANRRRTGAVPLPISCCWAFRSRCLTALQARKPIRRCRHPHSRRPLQTRCYRHR